MRWEPTDQFGALHVGQSEATELNAFLADVQSLADELRQRHGETPMTLTLDAEFAEVNGPDPEQVSHVLRCPWLENQDPLALLPEIARAAGPDFLVQSA
jgi:hypothetical protein